MSIALSDLARRRASQGLREISWLRRSTNANPAKAQSYSTLGLRPFQKGFGCGKPSEHGTAFVMGCEDDTRTDFTLAEPGNAISVGDETGSVEYLG